MAYNGDGTSGYLTVAQAVATGYPLTMFCWFNWPSATTNTLVSISTDTSNSHYFLLLLTASGGALNAVARANDGSSKDATSSTTAATNTWHSAAAVFSSATDRRVYLNGGNVGTNTTSATPSGVNRTSILKAVTLGATSFGVGQVAEAAIWNAALSAEEIAILSKGFSPLCLWWRLPNLVLHQDLIRPLNRPGFGPAMTAVGTTTVVAHPRVILPARPSWWRIRRVEYFDPYRLSAAAAHACPVERGWAASTGAERGTTYSIGEVSS